MHFHSFKIYITFTGLPELESKSKPVGKNLLEDLELSDDGTESSDFTEFEPKATTQGRRTRRDPDLETGTCTVKFLNFRWPYNFAVINLKFKQRGQTVEYCVKKMLME